MNHQILSLPFFDIFDLAFLEPSVALRRRLRAMDGCEKATKYRQTPILKDRLFRWIRSPKLRLFAICEKESRRASLAGARLAEQSAGRLDLKYSMMRFYHKKFFYKRAIKKYYFFYNRLSFSLTGSDFNEVISEA